MILILFLLFIIALPVLIPLTWIAFIGTWVVLSIIWDWLKSFVAETKKNSV